MATDISSLTPLADNKHPDNKKAIDNTLKSKRNLQRRLLEAMRYRNMSITNLAYALNISKSSVSEWLRGGGLCMNNLAAIALELNVSLDWLLMGKGNMALFGSVHPTDDEMQLVYHLRKAGPTAFDTFFKMISSIAKPILGDDPVNQILALDMLEQSRMALCVISHDGFIIDLNDVCLGLLGDNLDKTKDAIGSHFIEWLTEADIPTAISHMQQGLTRDYSSNFTCRIKRKPSPDAALEKPFIDIIISSLFHGSHDEGYFQCIAFPLD